MRLNSSWMEAARWDVAHSGLHIVRDPFNEIRAVLVLHIQHLLIDLHGHAATEHSSDHEVAAMTGIARRHHVRGVKHLLSELRNSESAVLLASSAGKWCEPRHKEMQTGEGHHVNSQLTQISVQLARKSETGLGSDSGHGGRHKVGEITVCWCCELQGTEADVVERLIVNTIGLISILIKLMN
jgi:hypothetical protein